MDGSDIYIFCKAGIVQYVVLTRENNRKVKALLAARGEANAKLVAQEKPGISPALVGSVEGETLERHIEMALADGCEGAWMRDDEGFHFSPWNDRPKPEPLRLTSTQIESIGTERQLTEHIAQADILAAVNVNTGEKLTLWKRPMSEVTARGFPAFVHAATFAFSSKPELRKIKDAINRLKNSDNPPSA